MLQNYATNLVTTKTVTQAGSLPNPIQIFTGLPLPGMHVHVCACV
jgi:hypothetical protein